MHPSNVRQEADARRCSIGAVWTAVLAQRSQSVSRKTNTECLERVILSPSDIGHCTPCICTRSASRGRHGHGDVGHCALKTGRSRLGRYDPYGLSGQRGYACARFRAQITPCHTWGRPVTFSNKVQRRSVRGPSTTPLDAPRCDGARWLRREPGRLVLVRRYPRLCLCSFRSQSPVERLGAWLAVNPRPLRLDVLSTTVLR
jgi:hypothetical protein